MLKLVAEFDGDKRLPCVRSYENDLARLSLIGPVDFEQALTAAAADGGEAADEHIDSRMEAMVVETVYPGPSEDKSTVSTRLFLPARKVKEKASKLRNSLPKDILSSTSSRNILALTFRQVVLQQLWNFELVSFGAGSERDMEDLENSREVPMYFTLSSSDETVISVISEAVCICAFDNSFNKSSNEFFGWFHKPKKIMSRDSSVVIHKLLQDEIVDTKFLVDRFNTMKAKYKPIERKQNYWWALSEYSKLEKIGGPEFSNWAMEYIPAYKLQIDTDILKNVRLEGWKEYADNRWEVLLTLSQMVGLAGVLDVYYEDIYTLPFKQLSCSIENFTDLSLNKKRPSVLKLLSITFLSGIAFLTVAVLTQLCLPRSVNRRMYPEARFSPSSSEVDSSQQHTLEASKVEALCILIVRKVKDAFAWPGDINVKTSVGAWTGDLPVYLRNKVNEADSKSEDMPSSSSTLEKSNAQDIASYQVVLTSDGKIIGFQPTSRVAVNHWAANPLAKELYGGKKLTPGLVEPGLKIDSPKEIVVIELLMSVNSGTGFFALARPNL